METVRRAGSYITNRKTISSNRFWGSGMCIFENSYEFKDNGLKLNRNLKKEK